MLKHAYAKLNVIFKSLKLTWFYLSAPLLLLLSVNAHAASVDNDKQKHFIAETFICGATMMYTESWWQTLLVGASVGLLKEGYDSRQPGNEFSTNDMVANMLGCAAGLGYGAAVIHFSYEKETDTPMVGISGRF